MKNATARCLPGGGASTSSKNARDRDLDIVASNTAFPQHHLNLADISALVGGRLGRHDVACPICGPHARAPVNRGRRVLRVWLVAPTFASFYCARCGVSGYAADHRAQRRDPAAVEQARAAAMAQRRRDEAESRSKAQWFWRSRQPITGSIAETYLRECRGYSGRMPGTLGFLPARGIHPPAMIAAFGTAIETLPGEIIIHDTAVRGVHLTKLKPDGSGKAGTEADKIMIGIGNIAPIMLAPPNDGLGLCIAEGIEDALTFHAVTGLGAWAAGSASRLPALADAVPDYIESVTILVDADIPGMKNAVELAERLDVRRIETRLAWGLTT